MDTETKNNPLNPINYKESSEDREHAKKELILDTLQTLSIKYLDEDATDFLNDIFKDEILKREAEAISKGTKFMFPLPQQTVN